MSELKLPHYVQRALKRLENRTLVLTASHSEEAENNGGGFLYSTHPDGRKFPTASALYAIRNGLVEPMCDGLIDGHSQTYQLKA